MLRYVFYKTGPPSITLSAMRYYPYIRVRHFFIEAHCCLSTLFKTYSTYLLYPNKIYKVFPKQKNKTASYLTYFLLILKKPNQEIYQKQPLEHKDNKCFISPIASSSMLWLMQHSFQISSFFFAFLSLRYFRHIALIMSNSLRAGSLSLLALKISFIISTISNTFDFGCDEMNKSSFLLYF